MKKTRRKNPALPIAESIIKGVQEKKGHEIVCLDLTKINSAVCEYFIICHGDSHRQVEAISASIEEQVKKNTGERPWHHEGNRNTEWVVIDYVDVVAHVFLKEKRIFYNLEGLWADAEIMRISGNGSVELKREKKPMQKGKPVRKQTPKRK